MQNDILRESQSVPVREPEATPRVRAYTIRICDDCYALKCEMCHNPECVFCRRTMQEVGDFLDALLIRPVIDGERLDLHPLDERIGQ